MKTTSQTYWCQKFHEDRDDSYGRELEEQFHKEIDLLISLQAIEFFKTN